MKEISTHIDIDAAPSDVWAVLTDLEGWSEWNPFIPKASGIVAVGERLQAELVPPGRKATTFKPTVTEANPNVTFEWLGRVGMPGVFDGRHRFDLEPIDGGTRFRQSERFTGVLSRPIIRMIRSATTEGFDVMNSALKERVESAKIGG